MSALEELKEIKASQAAAAKHDIEKAAETYRYQSETFRPIYEAWMEVQEFVDIPAGFVIGFGPTNFILTETKTGRNVLHFETQRQPRGWRVVSIAPIGVPLTLDPLTARQFFLTILEPYVTIKKQEVEHEVNEAFPGIIKMTAEEAQAARPGYVWVLQAAIIEDGVLFTLPRPYRHDAIVRSIVAVTGGRSVGPQGFLLSNGHFACRKSAVRVAIKAGQLPEDTKIVTLHSEDLW